MTIRRSKRDDRTATEKRVDAELAARGERGALVSPGARKAALAVARQRGEARRAARARLQALGAIELPLVIERRRAEVIAYVLGLPGVVGRAATKKAARGKVVIELRELIAADPAQVLEAVEAGRREEEMLLLEVEAG